MDGSPLMIRDCLPQALILVIEPVAPKQTLPPSGPVKQCPLPPEPASATSRSPDRVKDSCRGLFRPLAITVGSFDPPP